MIERFHHRGWHYGLLTAIGLLTFFLNLGGATLWDVDEGRNVTCAVEMFLSGNWIVPTFNGELRSHKPVLLYWLQMVSFSLFGINEFAARFPSAVAALGTVVLAYELARSMFSRSTGFIAGVIVATTPMLCGAARFANQDALLNFFTVLTFTVFWLGANEPRWWWFALLGVTSGLAVLAKGPVGCVLPGGVIALFLLWDRRAAILLDLRWGLTTMCFVVTAFPWYILVGLETHGEFLRGFFLTHNLERGMSAMEGHRGFPGYYLVILLVGTAPWSIFLGVAWWFGFWSTIRSPWTKCHSIWSRAAEATGPADDHVAAYRLLTCWLAVFLLFFSVAATKLPNYVLPVVVPCGLLVARFLQRWRTGQVQAPGWLGLTCVGSLACIGLGLAAGLAAVGGVGELGMMRGRFLPGLEKWAPLGVVPLAAAGACWYFARQRQFSRLITAVAVTAVLFLAPLAAFASVLFNHYKAPQGLVAQADALRLDEDIRIGCWQVEYLPSLNFYVRRNVEHLHTEVALKSFLESRLHVMVFIPREHWQGLEKTMGGSVRVLGRQYDMYHHAEIIVLTNR